MFLKILKKIAVRAARVCPIVFYSNAEARVHREGGQGVGWLWAPSLVLGLGLSLIDMSWAHPSEHKDPVIISMVHR